ncbi:class I adenylate-forming enzyme family protein [Sulfurivermis fontis]|uniref:class I adenylate-forming enzyme family protein n=1 Tax=Sulfurivermis fontis TaxID=1972068 RepID=UPI000FD92F1D|nr:AMP-binding protein [Sulfurivermis fontis]
MQTHDTITQLASDLARKTAAAIALLQAAGAGDGRPIAVISASPAAVCVLAHACAALGLPLMPLDPGLPDATLADLLAQAGVSVVIADLRYQGYGHIDTAALLAAAESEAIPSSRLAPNDIALLIATSGSSGQPRAVMLTADNLTAAARASATRTPLRPGDRWLACLPLFHIGGFSILTRCALAGAEAVLLPGFDAATVWQALRTERITHLSLVPAMLAQLLECSADAPPATLRHVLIGGAALAAELAERAVQRGWPLQPTYGMSETASQVATLERLPLPWRTGQLGRPLPGVELAVTHDGRLKIRGPMVMAGYANPELQRGDGLQDGWFVSNDLAEISNAGELRIIGRADAVIISGGKKVHPALVEELLLRCPGVTTVAVVGRPDPTWGEIVTAIYSGTPDEAELLAWCREHIAGAARPRAALRVAALPQLSNGKPDRQAIRQLAASM